MQIFKNLTPPAINLIFFFIIIMMPIIYFKNKIVKNFFGIKLPANRSIITILIDSSQKFRVVKTKKLFYLVTFAKQNHSIFILLLHI